MTKPAHSKHPQSFANGVGRALRSAARAARKTAEMHGTPIYIWERGKVVAVKPKPPLSRYALGKHYESFVRRELASGRYSSASKVIVAGLKLLEKVSSDENVGVKKWLAYLAKQEASNGADKADDAGDDLTANIDRQKDNGHGL